jgi:ATP-dependent Clp protease, protease subunit
LRAEDPVLSAQASSLDPFGGQFPWITEFTEELAIRFHEAMMFAFEQDPYRPIILHINSDGGNLDALFSMIDTMDSIRSAAPPEFKFLTVAKGKACSAAAALLSYGDYRFAEPNARIMLHQISYGMEGSHPANATEFKEAERVNERFLKLIKKQCKLKMSLKELETSLSHNGYFTPQEAKAFGLIDIIGYPKLITQKVYDVTVLNAEAAPKKEKKRAN